YIQEPCLPPPGLFVSTKLTFCNYISGVIDGVHKLTTDWRNHLILHSTTDRLNSSSRCHSNDLGKGSTWKPPKSSPARFTNGSEISTWTHAPIFSDPEIGRASCRERRGR